MRQWHNCIICSKPRFITHYNGEPRNKRCRACSNWKGGQHVTNGYVFILRPDHPFNTDGYVTNSRLVLEAKLGRYLMAGCIPHHKNDNKRDDRPENLEELLDAEHRRLHGEERRGKDGRFQASIK